MQELQDEIFICREKMENTEIAKGQAVETLSQIDGDIELAK